jgi:ribose transport system substrate-binding protein
MLRRTFMTTAAALLIAGPAMADAIADAMANVEKFAGQVTTWDGPTTGPKAAEGKLIVVLAGDMKNGGIIINGFDAVEQQAGLDQAAAAGIPMVSWHAGPVIGANPGAGVAVNVSTDAMEVSTVAAQWAFADAGGKPGVIIFTDSTYSIAIAKADKIKETIEALGGTVLEYVDTPIAETSQRMPSLTTSLLQKYGDKWTHALAINDIHFDFMGPALAAAGVPGDGAPKAVAAGDGSEGAYQRIRSGQYQAVTVAEPLNLQGWQLVDELNRAMQGEAASGYVSPLHVVTTANVGFDGGDKNIFDPGNGYREAYAAIWGK